MSNKLGGTLVLGTRVRGHSEIRRKWKWQCVKAKSNSTLEIAPSSIRSPVFFSLYCGPSHSGEGFFFLWLQLLGVPKALKRRAPAVLHNGLDCRRKIAVSVGTEVFHCNALHLDSLLHFAPA